MTRIRLCGTVETEVYEEIKRFHAQLLREGKVGSFSDSFEILVREGLKWSNRKYGRSQTSQTPSHIRSLGPQPLPRHQPSRK